MAVLAWSRCDDGGICAAKILRKHATAWVVIWSLSPRLSPDFSSQTRSITACWRGRFCLAPAVCWARTWLLLSRTRCVTGSNLVAHWSLGARWPEHIPDSLARIAGEGWGEGIPQHSTHQALWWFVLWQCVYSLYRSTPFKQGSGVHRVTPIFCRAVRFGAVAKPVATFESAENREFAALSAASLDRYPPVAL